MPVLRVLLESGIQMTVHIYRSPTKDEAADFEATIGYSRFRHRVIKPHRLGRIQSGDVRYRRLRAKEPILEAVENRSPSGLPEVFSRDSESGLRRRLNARAHVHAHPNQRDAHRSGRCRAKDPRSRTANRLSKSTSTYSALQSHRDARYLRRATSLRSPSALQPKVRRATRKAVGYDRREAVICYR